MRSLGMKLVLLSTKHWNQAIVCSMSTGTMAPIRFLKRSVDIDLPSKSVLQKQFKNVSNFPDESKVLHLSVAKFASPLSPLRRGGRASQHAAIDSDLGPCHVCRFVGGQKHSDGSNLIHSPKALKRRVLHDRSDAPLTIRTSAQNGFPHRREDGSRVKRITTNVPPLLGTIESDRFRVIPPGGLAGCIGRGTRYSYET